MATDLYLGAKEFAPMKIWEPPKEKELKVKELLKSGDYFGSVKKDGFWYQFEKTKEGKCYLFSRTISTKTGHLVEKSEWVPHITKILDEILPNGSILIGEIYYPNRTSKDVTKVMQCLLEKALERQEKDEEKLHYYVHDIIYYKDEDIRQMNAWNRYNLLRAILCGIESPYIELAEGVDSNLEEYIQSNFAKGEEGTVLKKKNSSYQDGKRPAWETLKFKTLSSVDVVIIGVIPATKEYKGKELETWQYWENCEGVLYQGGRWQLTDIPVTKGYFYGWNTSLEIGYKKYGENYESIGTVSSGLSENIITAISNNPDSFIGQVIEVECMSIDKEAETLRHPRFVRFREDKTPQECDWISIFEK